MITKLKEIYQNKIIENVENYSNDYYYFYYPDKKGLFGIEKSISKNEYNLIKASFIEKIVYDESNRNQKIYEYLLENKSYPFTKKMRIILFDHTDASLQYILEAYYKEVKLIQLGVETIAFCAGLYDDSISELSNLLSSDLGYTIKIHEGIFINKEMSGKDIFCYITLVKNLMNDAPNYSNMVHLLKLSNKEEVLEYTKLFRKLVIKPLLEDTITKDMILTYFKLDLNVSQTSKNLYMNRNSLINKFDSLYKQTGFNLQKFEHCAALYFLIAWQGNE